MGQALVLGATDTESDPKPPPPATENKAEWQKIQTAEVPMQDTRQFLTPGLYDSGQMHIVTFPADGTPVDLGLPHDGKEKDGKPIPPLMGVMKAGFVWIDLNGNGKQESKETGPLPVGGSAGPFVWNATYEDGTTGPYVFKVVDIGEANKAAIVRMCARQAKIGKNSQIILFDDDGNGKYDDQLRDALIIDNQPVTLLGRQIYIDGKLHELLVHPAGQTIEVRPMETVPIGAVNLFSAYKPPQKADNLKIHTLIVAGKDGAFSFSKTQPQVELPAGAYDLVFGLFSRGADEKASEWVVLKKGARTSFNVEAAKVATPAWGDPVEAKYDVNSDGKTITVGSPTLFGAAGEIYLPTNYKKFNISAYLTHIWLDKNFNNRENFDPVGTKKYEVLPNNDLKPVTFEWVKDDQMQIAVEYKSGILGVVMTKQRLQFIAKRK
ncbi:MAG: hypothetical protein HY291_13285 [Planctomycetes bacterium]|nr:hypothetical protein [Planctomycetota bacterium]